MYSTRQYKLFISHAWDYGEDYDKLVGLLNSAPFFRWTNLSVPEDERLPNHPTLPKSYRFLVRQLDDRIRQADCLVLIAAMYFHHRAWIQSEIEAALEYNKPIVAVKPYGSERVPSLDHVGITELVGWNSVSVVSAIKRHSVPKFAGADMYSGTELQTFYIENVKLPRK